ncbi:MAG TPA: FAD-binding oxidoreductase [Steroidobacteraceae bacterium]|nr:FAD-binding oxidoreductase [Steroidobacteraceae bacterium]
MTAPPGVRATDFAAALAQFEQTVGHEWLFTRQEDVDLYKDAFSPFLGEPQERTAAAAVAPASVDQVQQIVRIANRYRIPLYPISTGRNLGYGGSAPAYSGSVVLDLKRMNRILEVNEENASCLVEPGVSYFDLYRYIQERGLKLWVDVPDPGWGSLIGNALDRGGGYTRPQFRNHFDAHCGMEVVLPSGELLRTGMGALPNAQTWQQYKSGYGPWIDGIFSQSNFGIVTKMGFWLMPEPEAYLSGTVLCGRRDDLHALIRALNLLENAGITNGMPDLGSPLLGIQSIEEYARSMEDQPQPAPQAELLQLRERAERGEVQALEAYGASHGLAYWSLKLKFYGPARVIAAQWEHCKEHLASISGVRFLEGELLRLPLTSQQREGVHWPDFGIPTLNMYSIGARSSTNPEPTHGHMWFSPIIPRNAEAVFEANRVFAAAAREFNLPLLRFSLPSTYWERAFIFIFGLPVSTDIATNRRHRDIFYRLIRITAQHGWGEYRTAPAFQDAVMDVYSFNNRALLRFHETVKDAIDPNGILAAGRYGIWPKHLRRSRT